MSGKSSESSLQKVIRYGVDAHHRTMFVIVGKKSRNQVIKLYNMLSETRALKFPILWCCKKSNNHKNKDETLLPKIRYVSYKDTQKILGNTYGMCILEDFESLTPNIMARTIETVSGGGLIILLLPTISSLKSLYKYPMDIHQKFLTKSCDPNQINHRFNKRFVLSLGNCRSCFVIDDNLTILPISAKNIHQKRLIENVENNEFKILQEQIRNIPSVGELLETCKTLDQAKVVLKLIDCITEKVPKSTVSLTSSRGRGKSAALGLAVAASINFKLSNIFVTSPHPDNLKTFFQFVLKGFDALHYQEGIDYCLIQSTNPEFHRAIVRINVFRDHRQTIQYIHPADNHYITQAELVVIDEAAAIPIPFVKAMLGPHLVFMGSTIDGYEGTGRSLSLKLIKSLQLSLGSSGVGAGAANTNRSVQELTMDEPIRYKSGDEIEAWLTKLLCLDSKMLQSTSICPPLDSCELYYINRDALFSYNKISEEFLQRIMSLFVTSHYKNTPNDLQIMADAPSHHLFCLLGPISETKALPEVLVAIQVCLEGKLQRDYVERSLSKGIRANGDLIPWIIAEQHLDPEFAEAWGARIVRIATNPAYQRMSYGTRAVQLLQDYYEYKIFNIDEEVIDDNKNDDNGEEVIPNLQTEEIEPQRALPPLFVKLSERKPEAISYLGVAYGLSLTGDLLKFWQRCQFYPVYLRQTINDLTGEHSCVMIKELSDCNKLPYGMNFKKRFINLLSYQFKKFPSSLALLIIKSQFECPNQNELTRRELDSHFTKYDLKKLDMYVKNLLDYHLIMNVVPSFAKLFFLHKIGGIELSPVQSEILLGLGLQNKSVDSLAKEVDLPSTQLIALFNRMIKKFVQYLDSVLEKDIEKSLPLQKEVVMIATEQGLQEELDEAELEMKKKQKKELEKMKLEHLLQFSIKGSEDEWMRSLSGASKKSVVSVKSGEKRLFDDKESLENREVDIGSNTKRKKKK